MSPMSSKSMLRCALSRYMVSFLILSLVGFCASEALVSSCTSFLPRSLWTRGGAEATRSPFRAVLQVPRSRTSQSGVGYSNSADGEVGKNNKKSVTTNGAGTGTADVDFKSKQPKNGSSNKEAFDFIDEAVPAAFVAETSLPTDVGEFRLRAYRTKQGTNPHAGNEPCVIYSVDKSPFGIDGDLREDVPIRLHDQCLTSEVFRSQR
jgi:hypothetical protein